MFLCHRKHLQPCFSNSASDVWKAGTLALRHIIKFSPGDLQQYSLQSSLSVRNTCLGPHEAEIACHFSLSLAFCIHFFLITRRIQGGQQLFSKIGNWFGTRVSEYARTFQLGKETTNDSKWQMSTILQVFWRQWRGTRFSPPFNKKSRVYQIEMVGARFKTKRHGSSCNTKKTLINFTVHGTQFLL